ncbi:hypothetical protein PIB30_086935 [Stylosanthes scabra]|uniref:Uncharacterized protein n=1 Tax=Stylosanthes scabra TaxID=79078 RepID=A0ABU6YV59_9FABA|nr:hypothetical protein [Stylosanthes scabra]
MDVDSGGQYRRDVLGTDAWPDKTCMVKRLKFPDLVHLPQRRRQLPRRHRSLLRLHSLPFALRRRVLRGVECTKSLGRRRSRGQELPDWDGGGGSASLADEYGSLEPVVMEHGGGGR